MCLCLCVQGLEIVFRVGLAILQMNQVELIQLDMEGMLQVLAVELFHCVCCPVVELKFFLDCTVTNNGLLFFFFFLLVLLYNVL